MPQIIKIPAHEERHCSPCQYLREIETIHRRTDTITCVYACRHPRADEWGPPPTAARASNILDWTREIPKKKDRLIGPGDLQPSWCPLRNEPKPNQ